MKKAFTLAEVLITLAVIGVVAALTIPTLVQKYQKKQMYTQFMKSYNALSNAMESAVVEYGNLDDWNWGDAQEDPETGDITIVGGDNPIENYIYPQFKYVSKCDKASDCFASEYTFLGGAVSGNLYYSSSPTAINSAMIDSYADSAIVLPDGSVFAASISDGFAIFIDTNGKKGPNVYGRDLFQARYQVSANEYRNEGVYFSRYENNNCNPNNNSSGSGEGCASRMLEEGKMAY